jgi:hypothetical protein
MVYFRLWKKITANLLNKASNHNFKRKKNFHDKQNPKQIMTTKPTLQKILQDFLYIEDENKYSHESAWE